MLKRVSVIIPTYNRPDFLKKAIKTVLNQTYKNLEILVIDDASTADNQKIINNFNDNRIIYFKNKTRRGASYSRNVGIKNAKGKFIAFLDDDDEWMPEKIEKQVESMEKHKDVALAICYSLDKRFGHERVNKPPEIISHELILKSFNLSSTSSYLVRKDAIDEAGGFDILLPSAQEYDLAIRLSKHHKICCIPEILMVQHSTEGQISENWNRKIKGLMAIYHKHGKEYSSISMINHIKFVGMLGLFSMGYFVGNNIYNIIIPAKEIYES
ncbi:MAG: glycosyltransferase family 2 protein [Thermoplasmatales archaeon]|nr:glycosyltransferase family 2 protein [Thermoplasmatales archaeon]